MTLAACRKLFRAVLLVAALVTLESCGDETETPKGTEVSATALSGAGPRLDPCDAVPAEVLARDGLAVRKPKSYAQVIEDPELRFSGCQVGDADQRVAFYLEATNMTLDYLEHSKISANYSFQRVRVDARDGTLASNKQFPGQCLLLVRMSDYGLLLDGSFPDRSCAGAVDIASTIVPVLEGK
ncbi:DUF3558 family protein [Nocardia blacklockiae]|uniref:DUF3558 family protein n=1 Tax=Nocardia blacklockiae TaxID=480036 RepID=UPI00189582B6|nr:DUF3558 family protein [Nocardia blacklockiae]MBF6176456.1 DUF3558 family protein [Nocardia blacklockiae]